MHITYSWPHHHQLLDFALRNHSTVFFLLYLHSFARLYCVEDGNLVFNLPATNS